MTTPLQSYWRAARAPRYSLLFALPLLVAYETMAALLAAGRETAVRNGADVLLKSAFIALAGRWGPRVFEVCLIGAGIWLVARDMKRHGTRLSLAVFAGMLVEVGVLALAFGVVVGGLTSRLLAPRAPLAIGPAEALPLVTRLMVSLGAGLYEELLFRVVLVGLLAFAARQLVGWKPVPAAVAATIVGALLFSAFHYIGPYGDPLELYSFVYRMLAGVFFSALYLARGFGITAWTHALYDVLVLVVGG
ncbi:MAG: CPBP family intramembrane glutamic endopeptidase [Gemmatimonadales bacterium]